LTEEERIPKMKKLHLTLLASLALFSGAVFGDTQDWLDMYEDCPHCGEELDWPFNQGDAIEDFTSLLSGLGKSRTVNAVVYSENAGYTGTATVKIGRINKRNYSAKLNVAVSLFSGKKYKASQTVYFDGYGDEYYAYGNLSFKSPLGKMGYVLEYEPDSSAIQFSAFSEDGVAIESGSFGIGGALESDELSFSVSVDEYPDLGDGWDLVVDMPDGEPVYVKNGTKFSFDKTPAIKYVRYREDGDTWYELVGFDDESKTNYSGLKLTYTQKTGAFKGSFKVYATNEAIVGNGKPKLKKYTAKVTGCFVDGVGYGSAVLKVGKRQYTYPVVID